MAESGSAEAVGDREVVDQIHRADQGRADQHDHAAAEQTPAQRASSAAAPNAFGALLQGLGRGRDWSFSFCHRMCSPTASEVCQEASCSKEVHLNDWKHRGSAVTREVVESLLLQAERNAERIGNRDLTDPVVDRALPTAHI